MQPHCYSVGKGSSLGVSQTLANSLSICDKILMVFWMLGQEKAHVVTGKIGGN